MESSMRQDNCSKKELLIVLLVKISGLNTVVFKNSKTLKMSSFRGFVIFLTVKNYGFMQQNFNKTTNK